MRRYHMKVNHSGHDPFDPRDPLSSAFYYTFMASQDEPSRLQPDIGSRCNGTNRCGLLLTGLILGAR